MTMLEEAKLSIEEAKKDLDKIKEIHNYVCDKVIKLKKYRKSLRQRLKEIQSKDLTINTRKMLPSKNDQKNKIISEIMSMNGTIIGYEHELRYKLQWYNFQRKNFIKKEIRYLSTHIEYYQLKLSFL